MKSALTLRLLRLALFCTAAMLTLATGTSAFAQSRGHAKKSRTLSLPTVFVSADSLTPPQFNSDGTITLPDGTVLASPVRSADAAITLPDGTVHSLPRRGDSDGTIMLPDGTVVTPNSAGTITLPAGTVLAHDHGAARAKSATGTN